MVNEADMVYKIVVIGDEFTGKTTFINRLNGSRFSSDTKMTIGANFIVQNVFLRHISQDKRLLIKLVYWDCAGEERFKPLLINYSRGADGIVLFYSIDSIATFNNIEERWITWLRQNGININHAVVVGNKNDLVAHPKLGMKLIADKIENWELATGTRLTHYLVSCKDDEDRIYDPIRGVLMRIMVGNGGAEFSPFSFDMEFVENTKNLM